MKEMKPENESTIGWLLIILSVIIVAVVLAQR